MKPQKPTKKQAAILNFISQYTEQHDMSPSYREIMQALNLRSVSAVAEHISNCEKAGFLEKVPNQARSLHIIPIQNYEETTKLFNSRIAYLEQEFTRMEDELRLAESGEGYYDLASNSEEQSQTTFLSEQEQKQLKRKMQKTKSQVECLREAANILDIALDA